MRLHSRTVDRPARPLDVAAAVADRPGFCFLWSAVEGVSYVACDPVETSAALDPEPTLPLAVGTAGAAPTTHGAVPRWIGAVPYEACRAIERRLGGTEDPRPAPFVGAPSWYRFGAVAVIDGIVRVLGDDRKAVEALARRLRQSRSVPQGGLGPGPAPEPAARHRERVAAALEWIAAGELYQVNLARRFEFQRRGHGLGLLHELVRRSRTDYSVCLCLPEGDVVSTTPELFLRLTPDRRVLTQPIKGTRPRGHHAAEDAALAAELDRDEKERAELAMVIDVERNDLGRVAATGSVRLLGPPRVITHPTVHHRLADVTARLRPDVDRQGLLRATLPSGSITGAPKVRAMDAIATFEAERRGLYTGAFGLVRHDGGLELAMAIRTLTTRGDIARYHAGGGIVADSDPGREVVETYWKARQIAELAGVGQGWFLAGE